METLITVCKYMNFTHAAEELHIAQPTVSLHIHALEEHYGTKLFLFHGKKMALTATGKLILDAAITQENDDRRLRKKIQLQRQAPIRLGATLSVAENMLCEPLATFLQRHPSDFIKIDIDNTEHLLSKIDQGVLDAAFVEGNFPTNAFDAVPYRRDPYGVVCASAYPGRGDWTKLEDLFSVPLLLREPGSGTREILEKLLTEHRYTLHEFVRVVEIGSIHLIKDLVKAGCGVSFLYEATVQRELEDGSLIRIPLQECHFSHDIFFLWRKNSLYAEEYRSILRDFQ